MENITDQRLLAIVADPDQMRAFFSEEANLRTLIDSEIQRVRLATLIVDARMDLSSIAATLDRLSAGRVSLVAPRRD